MINSTLDRKTQQLDALYFDDVRVHEKYPELSTIMQIIFVLSHDQASVERGFNDNNLVLKLNQNDDSCGWEIYQRSFKSTRGSTAHTCYRSENCSFIQEYLKDVQY